MALVDTARLLASLNLDTRPFEAGVGRVNKSLGGMESRFGKVGKVAAVGVGAAAGVGLLALGHGIRGGIESLAELENATTSVDAAIKQVGLTGQVTSQQVAAWAQEIETNVGSAFDDKAITKSAATLIRYGKVSSTNLKPALQVMTDLAAKTGSVDSASALLAKALAAPEKAAGKLARVGVILTKEQQQQITAMVKAGDAAGAQKVLLDALTETTKGAAAATQGPYQRSLSVLRDVTEDAERALGEGFLPVIEKVRDILTKQLAKPGTIDALRNLGKGLAGGLDKLIDVATGLPWDSIGNAFKLVGQGSKAALDLFTGLPPWVQTAVLTGWGLNKLTGGGLAGIVGELGKGLIKGVLGMNAGVVNINAGVVNGAGGVPGAAPVAGAARTGLSTLAKVTLVGEAIGLVLAVNEVRDKISGEATKQAQEIHTVLDQSLAGPQSVTELQTKLAGIDQGIAALKSDPLAVALVTGPALDELIAMRAEVVDRLNTLNSTLDKNTSGSPDDRDEQKRNAVLKTAIDKSKDATESARIALATKLGTVKTSTDTVRDRLEAARIALASATQNSATRVSNTTSNAADRIVRAIYATRPVVTVNVSGSPDDRSVTTSARAVHKVGLGGP